MNKLRNRLTLQGIDSLWINWAMSIGSLALMMFLAMFFTKLWMPAFALGFAFILIGRISRMSGSDSQVCNILPYIAVRILIITAAIMVIINLYYMKFINPEQFVTGRANRNIPYITVLILSPVTNVVVIWAYLMRQKLAFCLRCTVEHGTAHERGFLGRVMDIETRYQFRILIYASLAITVYTWIYYFTTYSNVNYSPADRYYYMWIPVSLYLLSLVYLAMRYFKIYMFYRENVVGDASSAELTTILRYILICDDKVFLKDIGGDNEKLTDTPAMMKIHYRERMTPYDASMNFVTVSGIKTKPEIKFLYENANNRADSNIFHYLCILKSMSDVENSRLTGSWYTQSQLERLVANGEVAPLFTSEIHRVYTIMMARKTYDRTGYRLYDIKHYRPTFRLRELANLDNEFFNDPIWLIIARDNEDQPFFKLKKLWRKYVRGMEF